MISFSIRRFPFASSDYRNGVVISIFLRHFDGLIRTLVRVAELFEGYKLYASFFFFFLAIHVKAILESCSLDFYDARFNGHRGRILF